MKRSVLCALLLSLGAPAAVANVAPAAPGADDPAFPEPASLRPAVAFWSRVYLEATTDGGFVHDSEHLDIVYERLQFDGDRDRRRRERVVKARKAHWEQVLRRLSHGGAPSDASEAAASELFERALGRPAEPRDYALGAQRLRFQLGQRDKFRQGLIRSGAYEDAMRAVFRSRGLPEDLAFLPHVESSFNLDAYSKYGAAGIWQFMRSTGRRYLQIDYVVDERLDPMRATRAAAQLLKENYDALGTWPLALTAYNHGRAGMARAKQTLGTSDIATIVRLHRSRTFGFASRNFYAQFLAARKIVRAYESYFGALERDRPEVVDEVVLPFYANVRDLERHLGVHPDVVRDYNRSLRGPVFRAGKRIPAGFRLRLPAGTVTSDASRWLAQIPRGERHADQHRSSYYQVRRGDTLSRIAKRNGTSVSTLVALNNLPRKHRIFPGQVLQLPDRETAPARAELAPEPALIATAQASEPATPAAERPPEPESVALAEPEAVALPEPVLDLVIEPEPAEEPDPAEEPASDPAPSLAQVEPEETSRQETSPMAEAPDEDATDPAPPAETIAEQPVAPAIDDDALALAEAPSPAPLAVPGKPEAAHDLPPAPGEHSPYRRIQGNWVLVDSLETLGHFADWLEISPARLRKINRLSRSRRLQMGQKLKLDFSRVSPETFLLRRMEYHKGIEEDFFGAYRVTGTTMHKLGRGDSLWQLSHKRYGVPTWLIQRYNPDLNLTQLRPGLELVIPTVEPWSG